MMQALKTRACELTTMHCGGEIARLFEPDSREELSDLLGRLDDFIVIGGGSNMIFGDALITKPVIRLGKGFETITRSGDHIFAGASLITGKLLTYCAGNSLSGLEFLAGIPGTVGGALCMNAGTANAWIMDAVIDVEVMDSGGIHTLRKEDITHGYRIGGMPPGNVILGGRFLLRPATKEHVHDAMASFMEKRRSQPGGYSCGSVFRNPPGSSAGELIERAGMKGFRIGDAKVSEIHANFIINEGTASTADIVNLIRTIKHKVREKFDIKLIEEVRIID